MVLLQKSHPQGAGRENYFAFPQDWLFLALPEPCCWDISSAEASHDSDNRCVSSVIVC